MSLVAPERATRLLGGAIAATLYLGVVLAVFQPPVEVLSTGVANGALYGLTAVGIILVYRTNRIINFAAAGLGAVPGVLGALLIASRGWPFFAAMPIALVGSAALGAGADVVVIRRFKDAPRLILTVATLGVVQILAFAAIYVPIWLGNDGLTASAIRTPFNRITFHLGDRTVLAGQQIFAVAVVATMTLALGTFFRRSRTGIAVRAAAENPDRALLLGVPVRRISTIAWAVAGLFAGTTIFLRSTLIGVPFDGSLGFSVLLFALAAAVVGKMQDPNRALAAGIAIGVLEQASVASTGSPDLTTAIMLVVILAALLLQRGQLSRAGDAAAATFQVVKEFRPIPTEMRHLPEVRAARVLLGVTLAVVAVGLPTLLSTGDLAFLTLLPIYAIVAVSLVILTGWAGQISLGHMGIVGAAAATAGGFAANHNIDFFVALAIGLVAGVAVSVLIGLPAVRVQGLYLAVTTLAFAGAVEFYLLKTTYPIGRAILPSGDNPRVQRPVLWQRLDLTDERTYYYVCLAALLGVMYLAKRFRRSRSGRVLLAVRDNSRAAPAYAVDVARTRLTAFALSGAVAALAGVLFIYQQQTFDASTYGIGPSVEVFVATAIGGLTSIPGAVLGTVIVFGIKLFGERLVDNASLLVTGPGLLLVLYVFPGGLSQITFGLRDRFLRRVAERHDLLVPSLVADRRDDEPRGATDEPTLAGVALPVAS